MSGKSGPGVPKNLRKVTPGYDQAFTLPKGTSAAPIKQVATRAKTASGDHVFGKGPSVWSKVKTKDAKKLILEPAKKATKKKVKKNLQPIKDIGKGTAIGTVLASHVQSNRNDKRP
jgi:hypothetical protein|tara:strand:+ start:92 stop:439 length:348 start_codon:yes stop_codon:yes gene_type:complete